MPNQLTPTSTPGLSAEERRVLADAVTLMEHPNAAAKALTMTGGPTDKIFGTIAKLTSGDLKAMVKSGLRSCLRVAVSPALSAARPSKNQDWFTVAIAGVTGGLGGMFGLAAIPFELPFTTILSIRSIAEIARREGEDLSRTEGWLACMEVFSLAGLSQIKGDTDRYYRMRATAAEMNEKLVGRALDNNISDASILILIRIMGEVFGRTMLIVTDVTASAAFPVVGFGIGATLNVVLMDHFQRIARGHFAIRRLERRYGYDAVRRHYLELASLELASQAAPA